LSLLIEWQFNEPNSKETEIFIESSLIVRLELYKNDLVNFYKIGIKTCLQNFNFYLIFIFNLVSNDFQAV